MKRYWVDRAALGRNIDLLKARAGDATVFGVIKGNGYGLGTVNLAQVLKEHGIDHFAVTDVREVTDLRRSEFETESILMMEGTCNRQEIGTLVENRAVLSVGSAEDALRLDAEAKARDIIAEAHVKIDTGMGRYGFLPTQLDEILHLYSDYPNIRFTGIYTHFFNACNPTSTKAQYKQFHETVEAIRNAGIEPGMVHCCNSTAFWQYPEMHCDAVRIGSALLGRVNFSGNTGLTVIGQCQAELEEIRTIPAGHSVGYGAGWVAKRETRTAVLSIGYSNGFAVDKGYDLWRTKDCIRGVARYLKAWIKKKALYVTVNGKSCRVLGHVGMVNMVIDITDCDCRLGDMAVVNINPLVLKSVDVVFE